MENRIYEAFTVIKAGEALKNSTREYLQLQRDGYEAELQFSRMHSGESDYDDAEERRRLNGNALWKWLVGRYQRIRPLAMVCIMLLLFTCYGGFSFLSAPAYYVSIDVNPSVELILNRRSRVISAEAYNEDGEIVLQNLSVKGSLYIDAIDTIMESDAMQPYLTEDAALTFTVAADDSDKVQAIQREIDQNSCISHGGKSVITDKRIVDEAHENNLSFGKYNAYLELKKYDSEITADQCHHMSMSEINERIHRHKTACDDGNAGHHANHH